MEPVGGTGPNKDVMAFKVVTKKGADGPDGELAGRRWATASIRYREQSFSASTGALELEEHWDPHKLHIDGSADAQDDGRDLARDLPGDQAARRAARPRRTRRTTAGRSCRRARP